MGKIRIPYPSQAFCGCTPPIDPVPYPVFNLIDITVNGFCIHYSLSVRDPPLE